MFLNSSWSKSLTECGFVSVSPSIWNVSGWSCRKQTSLVFKEDNNLEMRGLYCGRELRRATPPSRYVSSERMLMSLLRVASASFAWILVYVRVQGECMLHSFQQVWNKQLTYGRTFNMIKPFHASLLIFLFELINLNHTKVIHFVFSPSFSPFSLSFWRRAFSLLQDWMNQSQETNDTH